MGCGVPNKIAGLSLVELMVATGIVGILTMVALPRFYSFIAQVRRGEAKSNLAHIVSLQSIYKIDHYAYYAGDAMTSNNGIGHRDGHGNDGSCDLPSDDSDTGLGNHLGFRPEGCNGLRYFYQMRGSEAVASAYSDDGTYIYPNCSGAGPVEYGYPRGDALSMAMDANKPTVRRNIIKHCPTSSTAEIVSQAPCVCTSWQPVGDWTPARSSVSVCQQVEQTRNFTKSCSGYCPTSITTSQTRTRNVNGSDPITAGTPINETTHCNCAGNEPRMECQADKSCTCTTTTTLTPPSVDRVNLYTCQCVNQTRSVTKTCTGHSTCPSVKTTQQTQRVFGTADPGDDTKDCSPWEPAGENDWNWDACVKVEGSEPERCEKRGTKARTCTNPCGAGNPNVCSPISLTYETLQTTSQVCTCITPGEERCASGFGADTDIGVAQYACETTGGIFGTSGTGDSVACSCENQCASGHGAGLSVASAQASCQGQGEFSRTLPDSAQSRAYDCTCTPHVYTEGAVTRLYQTCVHQAYQTARNNNPGDRNSLLKNANDGGTNDTNCTGDGTSVEQCTCDQINAIESDLLNNPVASEFLTDIKTEMINQNGNEECRKDNNIPCGESGTNCCNVTTFLDGE